MRVHCTILRRMAASSNYGQLLPQHEQLIRASAILPDVALARGYRSIQNSEDLLRLGFARWQCITPTLLVPLWNALGENALNHHRPDHPRNRDGKQVKYEFPAGCRMIVDVHPFIRDTVRDPTIPLWVTEGARKADSAISHGQCCIAIIGTWNWRGTNELGGKTVLPDWEAIALKDQHDRPRDVYLVFDSDVMEKKEVHRALARLGAFLKWRGAHVQYIYLPHGHNA